MFDHKVNKIHNVLSFLSWLSCKNNFKSFHWSRQNDNNEKIERKLNEWSREVISPLPHLKQIRLNISSFISEMCCVTVCRVPLTSLHEVPYECLGSQSQVWQPPPLAMFQVSGAQRSQCWPITFGRQRHWPLMRSQWQSADDGQLEGSLPSWLQTHSVDTKQIHQVGSKVHGKTSF